eukprot:TRINITY_DN45672_c0_g1_i1.p1 TRINITY_DN45672_c0_g1~~TRINITY_DN45672_c0_g1_i1.p1  ORF type:complete len:603 (+),score=145.64 TRINITY_DN45672_c0_g1_i1:53-1861(+)
MGLQTRGALCRSMQIVLFFALGSSTAAVLTSHEQKSNTSVAHFGPGACVSAWVGTGSHCVVQTACSKQPAFAAYALRLICVDKDGGRVLHSFETGGFEAQEIFDTLIVCDKCEAGDVDEVPQVFLAAKPDEKMPPRAGQSEQTRRSAQSSRAPAPAAAVAPGAAAGIVEVFPADPALEKTEEKITVLEEEVQNLTYTAALISQTINMMREKMLGGRNSSRVLRGSSKAKDAPGQVATAPAPMAAAAPGPARGPAAAVSRLAGKENHAEHDKNDKEERENRGRVVESLDGPSKVREAETPGRLAAPDSKVDKDGSKVPEVAGKVDKAPEKADHELEDKVNAEAELAGREAEEVALAALQDDVSETKPTLPPTAEAKPATKSVEHMPKAEKLRTLLPKQASLVKKAEQEDDHIMASASRPANDSKHKHATQKGEALPKQVSLAKHTVRKDSHSATRPAKDSKYSKQKHATPKDEVLPKQVSQSKKMQKDITASATRPREDSSLLQQPAAQSSAVQPKHEVLPSQRIQKASKITAVVSHAVKKPMQHASSPVLKPQVQSNSDSKIAALAQAKATVSSQSEKSDSEDLANVDNDQLADLLADSMEE